MFIFLQKISEKFEIVLFNNASKAFTESIVQQIMKDAPEGHKPYFSYVLSKD
jgi:hypothetical protein